MIPIFKLQIVDVDTGAIIRFPGGGPLERELIAACTEAIVQKGVGVFRTEAHVRHAVAAGITEAISVLKQDTRFVV